MKMKNNKGRLEAFFGIVLGVLILVGAFFLIYQNATITGFAINNYNGQRIQKLRLTSMCSPSPEIYRVWRVWNKNDINVEFNWNVYRTEQSGSGIAAADGYFYFNTTTVSGANTVRIFVNESQHDVKASSGEKCTAACIENWTCGAWAECIAENQARECDDVNFCNTTTEIPLLIQECGEEPEPEPCAENWICGNWSNCLNSSQIRECSDANLCNTTTGIPLLVQECNETISETNETEQNETQEEPPAAPQQTSGESSGGGGRGSSAPLVVHYRNKTEETKTESQETGEEIAAGIGEEAKTEGEGEGARATGFVALVGRAIDFLEENGINPKVAFGSIGMILLFVIIIILSAKYSRFLKMSKVLIKR